MTLCVRPIAARDEPVWSELFAAYRSTLGEPRDPQIASTVWGWLLRRDHGLLGLVAVGEDDVPVALAHLRWFARPDEGDMALYLDSLFTRPEARGRGAARALLREAAAIAAEGGATAVRWITAEDNATARRLYDRYATLTPWLTYSMPAAPRPGS